MSRSFFDERHVADGVAWADMIESEGGVSRISRIRQVHKKAGQAHEPWHVGVWTIRQSCPTSYNLQALTSLQSLQGKDMWITMRRGPKSSVGCVIWDGSRNKISLSHASHVSHVAACNPDSAEEMSSKVGVCTYGCGLRGCDDCDD